MIYKIQGEAPFQILASNFSIGPSNEGYTLQISADGENYSDLFTVGPNTTRMVTGVANGSFYRLAGNASEVSVNWERQCKDGQGGGGTGPQGPMGPQGPQGPAGSGSTGDSRILLSTSALPEVTTWEPYEDNKYTKVRETCTNDGDYLIHWNENENYTGVHCSNGAIDGSGYGMSQGPDGKWYNNTYPTIVAWSEDGKLYWDGIPSVVSMFDAYDTGSDKEGFASGAADAPESSVAALRGTQGLYQVVNGQWTPMATGGEGGDFVHLDNLSTAGETGITYEYDEKLMYWNPESGNVAEWYISIDNTPNDGATGLIFSEIPDGTVLFEMRSNTLQPWRQIVYSSNTLFLKEGENVITAATIGDEFIFASSVKGVYGYFGDHYIGFNKISNTLIQNVWDGTVNSGHYELLDKANHPYFHNVTTVGIPEWGQDGLIKAKNSSVSTKDYYINTTGTASTNRTTVLTNGTNSGPNRLFAPTTGGNEGQILTSAGANAAPVWSTLITAMQITSAEYEALVTKDPNTLYLIVDE